MGTLNWRDLALKVLTTWWAITRPRAVGVRGIIAGKAGRVLFVRHSYGDRAWHLPGGSCGKSESPDEALVREIHEETGLEVAVTRLVGVYFWIEHHKREHLFIFLCRPVAGEVQVQSGEIEQAGWFMPHDLPAPLATGMRRALADWRSTQVGFGRLRM